MRRGVCIGPESRGCYRIRCRNNCLNRSRRRRHSCVMRTARSPNTACRGSPAGRNRPYCSTPLPDRPGGRSTRSKTRPRMSCWVDTADRTHMDSLAARGGEQVPKLPEMLQNSPAAQRDLQHALFTQNPLSHWLSRLHAPAMGFGSGGMPRRIRTVLLVYSVTAMSCTPSPVKSPGAMRRGPGPTLT